VASVDSEAVRHFHLRQAALYTQLPDSLAESYSDAGHGYIVCCSLQFTYRLEPTPMKHLHHLRDKTISDLYVALDDESIATVQLSFTDGTEYAIVVKQLPLKIETVPWKGDKAGRRREIVLPAKKGSRRSPNA
jgi:hypothetical protein